MDPSSTVARTRAGAVETANAPIHRPLSNGQNFSHISAHGSSKLHVGNNYGDNIYVTYNCSATHGFVSPLSNETSSAEHLARTSQKRKRHIDDVGDTTNDEDPRQPLAIVLESLEEYSKSLPQMQDGDKGKEIATQLQSILACLRQSWKGEKVPGDLDSQLQRLEHQLQGARRIKINGASPRPLMTEVRKVNSNIFSVTLGHWTISLSTKTLTSQRARGRACIETFSALRVQHCSTGSSVSAFFGERDDIEHVTTVCPVIVAYNQVSKNAELFDIVKRDALDDFLRLLAIGEASLRDCDEESQSLLCCACEAGSVQICKFLVKEGADVDRRSPNLHDKGESWVPLYACTLGFTDMDNASSELALECAKVLLRAGADPTLILGSSDGRSISPLFHGLGEGRELSSSEPLAQILRESSPFFDIRTIRENGCSLWQQACGSIGPIAPSETLQLISKAGADINEINKIGDNCLHLCVSRARRPNRHTEFEALCFLLSVFDDIYAQNHYGGTVWEMVDEEYSTSTNGSYQHDLWYCALYRSGLACRLEIPPPTRRTFFAGHYKPKHYRAMLYLKHWPVANHLGMDFFQHFPSSAKEREQAPAFHQWNLTDLLMMEERYSRRPTRDDRGHVSEDEYSSQSEVDWEEESTATEEDCDHASDDESSDQPSDAQKEASTTIAES